MEEVTAYKCDFCDKWLRSKSGMTRHEKGCLWNPEKRACASCGNNNEYIDEQDYADYEQDTGSMIVRQYSSRSRWCDEFDFDIFAEPENLRKDCPSWRNR